MALEGNVKFLLAYQSGDFLFTPNTAEIIVNTGEIYRIDYTVLTRPVNGLLNIAYATAINDMENPLLFFGGYTNGLSSEGSNSKGKICCSSGGNFIVDL